MEPRMERRSQGKQKRGIPGSAARTPPGIPSPDLQMVLENDFLGDRPGALFNIAQFLGENGNYFILKQI
jgi:hypothetical protein